MLGMGSPGVNLLDGSWGSQKIAEATGVEKETDT